MGRLPGGIGMDAFGNQLNQGLGQAAGRAPDWRRAPGAGAPVAGGGGGRQPVNQGQQLVNDMAAVSYPQAMLGQSAIAANASMQNAALGADVQQQRTLADYLRGFENNQTALAQTQLQVPGAIQNTFAGSLPNYAQSIYGTDANLSIAGMEDARRRESLAAMLAMVGPMLGGGAGAAPLNINTDFGAGVSFGAGGQ